MPGRQRPRGGLDHHAIVLGSVRGDVRQIVGEAPELSLADEVNRRRGDDGIVFVHELRERVVEVAWPALEHEVRVLDLVAQRRVVQDWHHALAHNAAEEVVEVLDRRRTPAGFSLLDRVPGRRDIVAVIEQAQQAVDPIDRAVQLVLQGPGEQGVVGVGRVTQQVLLQGQPVVVPRRFLDDLRLDHRSRTGNRRVIAPDLFDRRNRLVSEEAVRIVEGGNEGVHRPLRAELRQRGGNVTTNPDVLALVAQRVARTPTICSPYPTSASRAYAFSARCPSSESSPGTKSPSDAPIARALRMAFWTTTRSRS